MTLLEMEVGQKVKVVAIRKGINAERRLFEMGIMPGAELELTGKHLFRGPLLLKVGLSQIAVGRGLAADVEVKSV